MNEKFNCHLAEITSNERAEQLADNRENNLATVQVNFVHKAFKLIPPKTETVPLPYHQTLIN